MTNRSNLEEKVYEKSHAGTRSKPTEKKKTSYRCAVCGGTRAQHNKLGVVSDHSYKMTVAEKKNK